MAARAIDWLVCQLASLGTGAVSPDPSMAEML
jgi:hypothetical protein